jgi:hypothetical protein
LFGTESATKVMFACGGAPIHMRRIASVSSPKITQPGSIDPGCAMNYRIPAAIKAEEAAFPEAVVTV